MLMALVLLAAVEGAAAPTVEVTLTGSSGTPVSAARRSLSDVARELREGRRAVGGFSAVESTVPQSREVVSFPPAREEEYEEARVSREEEPVAPPPVYVETYVPMWYGGGGFGGRRPGVRPPHVAHHSARPPRPQPGTRSPGIHVRPQPD